MTELRDGITSLHGIHAFQCELSSSYLVNRLYIDLCIIVAVCHRMYVKWRFVLKCDYMWHVLGFTVACFLFVCLSLGEGVTIIYLGNLFELCTNIVYCMRINMN